MTPSQLKALWKSEEAAAQIHGWDFSHVDGRCIEAPLPWDYKEVIERYRKEDMRLLDYDTGGGEFLLSLGHPFSLTAATEGYPPNVALCRDELIPLGIDFRACDAPAHIPFPDETFDLILNRHGSFHPAELHRLLKKDGLVITQQVGNDNDRELVDLVLPDTSKPFSHLNLKDQKAAFEAAGFCILEAEESFHPIRFTDVGAFVWFARIIEWEFPQFSVEKCFEKLLTMQQIIDSVGFVEGTAHRYLLVARK